MIDPPTPPSSMLALRHCQGKAIVNSINLEDGEERFEKVCPLLRTYGAAVIVGCIDETSSRHGRHADAKLAIAERARRAADRTLRHPGPRSDLRSARLSRRHRGPQYVGSAVETSKACG